MEPLNIEEETYKLYFNIGDNAHQYIKDWLQSQDIDPLNLVCIFLHQVQSIIKQWKLENYAELADLIQEKTGYKVVLLWGPKEMQQVDYVKQNMNISH